MTNEVCRFTLRITAELKEQLEENSKKMGISMNGLVAQILWAWAERRKP